MRYSSRTAIALLALWLSLTGCASWRLETQEAAEVIALKHPDKIRVQGPSLSQTVLYRPTIQGDSIIGRERRNKSRPQRAVALSDVASVATSRVDAGKTASLALGITAAFGMAALIAAATYDGPFDNCCQ
jgi:hypothetical protein